ncbi:hypothetical protein D5086_016286 [Populus alba]|uniref:Uncharacterized protein n=1 Tax=Populus alba TaxID=43335 RepID=A0ACC4BTJ9_POPAL
MNDEMDSFQFVTGEKRWKDQYQWVLGLVTLLYRKVVKDMTFNRAAAVELPFRSRQSSYLVSSSEYMYDVISKSTHVKKNTMRSQTVKYDSTAAKAA